MKAKLLLADNDEAVRAVLGGALSAEGYEVVVSESEREVIAYLNKGRVDIALLDLNLSAKRDWKMVERLTTRHPSVPVIITTVQPGQYRLAFTVGVGALMEKPLDLSLVIQTIEDLLLQPFQRPLGRSFAKRSMTRYFQPDT